MYLVAIVDCNYKGTATASSEDLGNIAQENTTADIWLKDQLQPPLYMVTVDQERELHKPKS